MIPEIKLTIEDLESACFAMDSWLDAFCEEEEWKEDAERIRRVLARLQAFIKAANRGSHLTIENGEDA